MMWNASVNAICDRAHGTGSTASIGRPPIRGSCDSGAGPDQCASPDRDDVRSRRPRSEWPDGRGRTLGSRGRQGDLGAPAPHRRWRGGGARSRHHDHRSDPAGDRRAARGVVGIRVVQVEHGVAARPRRGVVGYGPRPTGRSRTPKTPRTSTRPRSTPGSRRTRSATSRPPRSPSVGSGRSSGSRSTPGRRRTPRRTPTRHPARATCPSTSCPAFRRPPSSTSAADDKFAAGQEAAENADDYVRTTVYLATVLFLVGISGHFRVRAGGAHRSRRRRRGRPRHRRR